MAEALRVLYIDDEPALLDLCKIYLEKTGKFSVDISISGKEALTQLGKQQYDAIISDYQMPGMDGIDLLKAVRDSHGNIPFILFTGRGREEVVIEAINNGVDFYLQKGGDPKAQFAELEHKIRQAIARRQAENSLNESEKRLADIINFLPDATFAIDRSGQVIAWNRAIEEMTGVTAADILGKGEYEYAIPFYGKRRPILIDLLFKPEEDISKHYKGISREKDVLIAETDLSQPKGVQRTLMGKASPLFNQKGEISGAIESIRDITRMKETEQSLQEQNQVLAAMNQFSLELASLPVGESIGTFIVRKLMELTGGVAAWYSDYHPADHTLIISHLESGHGLLEKAVKILGKDPHEIKTVVSADQYMEIVSSAVKKLPTLTDVSFGQIPPAMSFAIQKVLGIDHFFGLVYVIEGELFATSVLAIGKGKQAPSVGLLESFSHMVAVSLRRRSAEEKLRAGEDKFRTVADFTYGWEYWEAPDHSIIYMSPSCERISGYSREEFQQNPSLNDSIVDPRDMEVWENHRKEADETKTALSLDIRILRKDGELCWINHTCHPVFDSAGRHLGRRASNRDITEKKRVDDELRAAYEELNASQEELQAQFEALIQGEQQIRESEEKFRLLLQHVPSISVQGYNMDGTTQYWNDASESLYGYTAQEAVGKNLIDLVIPPEMKDEVRKAITYMAESGQPIPASELSLMRKDGTRVAVFSSHAIVKRARGGTELFCIDIDLTERKQAEEALSESEQKYREIFEKSVTGIFKTTHDGLLVDVNDTFARIYDYSSAAEMLADSKAGRHDYIRRHLYANPEDQKEINQILAEKGKIENYETRHIKRDGTHLWVSITARTIRNKDDTVLFYEGSVIDITERKQAEEALRESEEKYRNLSILMRLMCDNVPDMIWAKDLEKRYIYVNRAICSGLLNAIDTDEPVGKLDMFFAERERTCHADDPDWHTFGEICRDTDQITMDAGTPQQFDEYGNVQGKFLFLDVRKAPFIDEQGTMIGTVGSARDITERKRAEEALRESEELLRDIIEKNPLSIQIVDREGFTLKVNPAFIRLFGSVPPPDFSIITDIVKSHPELENHISRVKNGEPVNLPDMSFNPHDIYPELPDVPTRVRAIIFPLNDRHGKPQRFIFMHDDITEQRRAEDALRESEKLLSEVFDNANDAVFLLERTQEGPGTYLLVNDKAVRMLGYSRDELLEMSPRDIVPSDIAKKIMPDVIKKLLKDGHATFESAHRRKDGCIYPIEVSTHTFRYKGKDVDLSLVRDITERKRAEEAILQANKKLNLLSGITRHDINNQLLVLNGFLKLLQNKATDPAYEGFFTRITKASSQISSMILFTKEYEEIGVKAPIWQDCRNLVDNAAKQTPLGQVMVKNDLPTGAEVLADTLIVKVFYNLMDNAVRYGGKIRTIRFSALESGDDHVIVCEDDGEGVVIEEKEKIFERGFGKNTGLGLFLSREILDITGITIRETSEPGKGARFEIVVPKGMWRIVGNGE